MTYYKFIDFVANYAVPNLPKHLENEFYKYRKCKKNFSQNKTYSDDLPIVETGENIKNV